MNIIFLDFDGVLATDRYTEARLESQLNHRDCFGTLFNPECVWYLSQIISKTNAQIVITSDWRNYLNILLLRLMWIYRKMPGRLIGSTTRNAKSRAEQIEHWLIRHPKVEGYVIIDDMDPRNFSKNQLNHFVMTPHFTGLDEQSAEKAIAILQTR